MRKIVEQGEAPLGASSAPLLRRAQGARADTALLHTGSSWAPPGSHHVKKKHGCSLLKIERTAEQIEYSHVLFKSVKMKYKS